MKKIKKNYSGLMLLTAMTLSTLIVNGQNIIAHWKMDEGAGTIVADASPTGMNGEITGATWVKGKSGTEGKALHFGDDDFGVNFFETTTNTDVILQPSYTLAMWIKFNTMPSAWVQLFAAGEYRDINMNYNNMVLVVDESGNLALIHKGETESYLSTVSLYDIDEWLHVTITVDDNSKIGKIFLNGELDATLEDFHSFVAKNDTVTTMVRIGKDINGEGWGEIPDFTMDEVMFYDGALSDTDVKKLYEEVGSGIGQNNFRKIKLTSYPNPFTDVTTINYSINSTSDVRISVNNATGKEVSEIVNCNQHPGNYTVNWNAVNNVKGVYFIHLETEYQSVTKKVVLQ